MLVLDRLLHVVRGRTAVVFLALATALLAVHGESQAPPTETLNVVPVADAYVSSGSATTNFGTGLEIRADGSPTDSSFLRFTVTGVAGRTVQHARLRLQVTGISTSGGTIHKSATARGPRPGSPTAPGRRSTAPASRPSVP
jgi:hypothetical protein